MRGVLVTGASGFVGGALVKCLADADRYRVVAAVRNPDVDLPMAAEFVRVDGLGPDTDWQAALGGISVVVHCAARVHVMDDRSADPLLEFRRINVEGTLNLAHQAAEAGVKRFIFISSIKVNGEGTSPSTPYRREDIPEPIDPYGISKREAEEGLREIAAVSGVEVVVIRPPLVYGPGVTANFLSMMRWLHRGVPLPLGAIHNKRSLVAKDNLVDLISTCIDHPAAGNEIFLASDGEDLSTTALLRRLGQALGKPARLLPVPAWLLTGGAALLGKKAIAQRVCGNLQLDISHTRDVLGWEPPVSVDAGLQRTAEAFLAESADSEHVIGEGGKLLRLFDVAFSVVGLVVGLPILLALLVAGYFDTGSPLFRQQRVGRRQQAFTLVKFRTMRLDTASVASHMADGSAITPLGRFMRKTKLDELPQLWNVLKGEMSLVGPRPGLFNQEELTAARDKQGVFAARPGITGLAQVNGIDMSTPELLAETDRQMLETLGVVSYFKYILQTVTGRGSGDAVKEP